MPTLFKENKVLSSIFIAIVVLAVLAGGYLWYLQASGVPDEPAAQNTPTETSKAVILEGMYVCLPHTDGTKAKECTPGIRVENKDYYALDMAIIVESGTSLKLTNGMKILAGGVIVPIEEISTDQWQKYPIRGIMSVEEVAKL